MNIILTLPDELSDRAKVRLARGYLKSQVDTNLALFEEGLLETPLYESDVVYLREPPGTTEEFADALTALRRGWGDCDDLAAWRCAELRHQGVPATLSFRARYRPRGLLVHCVVRHPDGRREDPSKALKP